MRFEDGRLSLFLTVGQLASREIYQHPGTAPQESLPISSSFDLALALPEEVRRAARAALVYKLLFVFENFLRGLVLDVLSEQDPERWWAKVPKHVQQDVEELERKEETKGWMALGSRSKLSLTTYPQLLDIVEQCWKEGFDSTVRDKSLIQEARHISHLRNAIGHMTEIPDEETERIKQVMRDWFRMVAP
jgi:hypothetical protein